MVPDPVSFYLIYLRFLVGTVVPYIKHKFQTDITRDRSQGYKDLDYFLENVFVLCMNFKKTLRSTTWVTNYFNIIKSTECKVTLIQLYIRV